MPVKPYQLIGGKWKPLDGVGPEYDPGGVVDPPPGGWRAHPLLLPDPGKVVWGFSPTARSLGELESIWGATSQMVRIYGGTLSKDSNQLQVLKNQIQTQLNGGRIPVVDINTSAMYSYAGFTVDNMETWGGSLWDAQAAGHLDTDGVGPFGRQYYGFDSVLNMFSTLTPGACPTNNVPISKDHEPEDMNEGGGSGKGQPGAPHKRSGNVTEFRAAWQRMRARETSLGVTNLLWFLDGASGVGSWGENMTDTGSDGFYAGHSFVDFVAWDPYNSAGLPGRDTVWRYFTESAGSGMLNKFGQLTWWRRNFNVNGEPTLAEAQAQGHTRVYKPAMLAEFGTMDSWARDGFTWNAQGTGTGSGQTGTDWAQDIINYVTAPGNAGIFRWLLYYNNGNMDIGAPGSNRRAAFTGKGTHSVWQT